MPERTHHTPRAIAQARGINAGKVLAWIARGELEAVNVAAKPGRRPRWRISAEALAAFDRARSSRFTPTQTPSRRPRATAKVIQFF